MPGRCPINTGCLLLCAGHHCMGEAIKRLRRQGAEECLLNLHMKTFILILGAYIATSEGFPWASSLAEKRVTPPSSNEML